MKSLTSLLGFFSLVGYCSLMLIQYKYDRKEMVM